MNKDSVLVILHIDDNISDPAHLPSIYEAIDSAKIPILYVVFNDFKCIGDPTLSQVNFIAKKVSKKGGYVYPQRTKSSATAKDVLPSFLKEFGATPKNWFVAGQFGDMCVLDYLSIIHRISPRANKYVISDCAYWSSPKKMRETVENDFKQYDTKLITLKEFKEMQLK